MIRGRRRLDIGFPMLGDRIKAEDYWRSVNRHDLIRMSDQIVAEFRAYHSENSSRSWPATWKTWYVRTVRIIKPPNMPEPCMKGRNAREAFRAPVDQEECVSREVVEVLASRLRAKSGGKTWK